MMTNSVYGIYGASGCGRGIMPLLRQQGYNVDSCYFIDDNPLAKVMNGHKVLTFDEFVNLDVVNKQVAIAIASSKVRAKLAEKLIQDECEVLSIKANTVTIMDNVDIGEGVLLSPHVTITSNIKIGKFFHANLYSYVEHDCIIGDFVTFAPRASCNGNVHIHDHAYIGTGAVIKQGTPDKPLIIGEGAVVGMGAVVTKDVPAGAVVVGNPAKPLVKR